jgi:hypothetical protein
MAIIYQHKRKDKELNISLGIVKKWHKKEWE